MFQLQTLFTANIILSQNAGSIRFDAKRLEKKVASLSLCLTH